MLSCFFRQYTSLSLPASFSALLLACCVAPHQGTTLLLRIWNSGATDATEILLNTPLSASWRSVFISLFIFAFLSPCDMALVWQVRQDIYSCHIHRSIPAVLLHPGNVLVSSRLSQSSLLHLSGENFINCLSYHFLLKSFFKSRRSSEFHTRYANFASSTSLSE